MATPPSTASEAVYSGYCGMGIMRPSRSRSATSDCTIIFTAGEAPSVRKREAGSHGKPSRSLMKAATSSRMPITPCEWLYAPVPPVPIAAEYLRARSMASGAKISAARGSSISVGQESSASTWRENVMGFCPSCCGFPMLQ